MAFNVTPSRAGVVKRSERATGKPDYRVSWLQSAEFGFFDWNPSGKLL
jgi:hypothetical protein